MKVSIELELTEDQAKPCNMEILRGVLQKFAECITVEPDPEDFDEPALHTMVVIGRTCYLDVDREVAIAHYKETNKVDTVPDDFEFGFDHEIGAEVVRWCREKEKGCDVRNAAFNHCPMCGREGVEHGTVSYYCSTCEKIWDSRGIP